MKLAPIVRRFFGGKALWEQFYFGARNQKAPLSEKETPEKEERKREIESRSERSD